MDNLSNNSPILSNGLSDSEIVKALEESISFDEPYESNFTLIRIEYIKYALDPINRLQANNQKSSAGSSVSSLLDTINGLTLERSNLIAENNRLQAENERLKAKQEKCFYCTEKANKKIGEIKAEAYKEFAERLKAKFAIAIIKNVSVEFATGYKTAFIDITNKIDNLLKELVGEDNASE